VRRERVEPNAREAPASRVVVSSVGCARGSDRRSHPARSVDRSLRGRLSLPRLAALALALTTLVSIAHAHLGHVVVRAERYLKIDLEPTQARFVVSLTLGPDETVRIQSAADTDRDGAITQAEADAYMAEWGRGLATELPFEVDGEPVTLAWAEPWMSPLGTIERVPGSVEMVARVPLEPGRHVLRLRDGMRVETFDRTDVNVTTSDSSVRLVAAGEGAEPRELTDRFAYGPQNAPEVITVIAELPGAPPTVKWLAIGGGGAFVLVAIGAWIAVMRRRKR
jgi:hypothetical protein